MLLLAKSMLSVLPCSMRYIWAYLDSTLSAFRFYRRARGGTWYLVHDPADALYSHPFWTNDLGFNLHVIETKHYLSSIPRIPRLRK